MNNYVYLTNIITVQNSFVPLISIAVPDSWKMVADIVVVRDITQGEGQGRLWYNHY